MKVNFNHILQNPYGNNLIQAEPAVVSTPHFKSRNIESLQADTFIRSKEPQDIYMQKLNALFPNGALDKIYAQMGKELGIDILPTLKFYKESDGIVAGGFTFNKNEISFSLNEIFDNNHKVVMVKNGMYKNLTSPKDNMPLFIDKNLGEQFISANEAQFKKIVDGLKLIPMTDNDFRKFIIHKMYHELIHAQQHMIMRSTEGIGEKEIIKAWTHLAPKNEADVEKLNKITENIYNNSFWTNKKPTQPTHKKDSEIGKLAYIWLDAVKKYPPVDSPEYTSNAIEADAFKRSYEYLVKNFGPY